MQKAIKDMKAWLVWENQGGVSLLAVKDQSWYAPGLPMLRKQSQNVREGEKYCEMMRNDEKCLIPLKEIQREPSVYSRQWLTSIQRLLQASFSGSLLSSFFMFWGNRKGCFPFCNNLLFQCSLTGRPYLIIANLCLFSIF